MYELLQDQWAMQALGWEGGRYFAVHGHWVAEPPGYRYVHPHWEQRNTGWCWQRGGWVN